MNYYDIILAKKLSGGGGGGSATLIDKNINANGTYNASSDNADGYKKVVVSVPNSYSAGDEGKVVSSGALVSQSSATYTSNNTYDTTLINSVTVNVSGSSSPIQLIDTISVTENVRAVNIDLTPYSSYDVVFIFEKFTLSASDYLYYVADGSTPSGGSYTSGTSVTHKGWCGYLFNMPPQNTRRAGKLQNSNMQTINSMGSLYIYTYTATKTILAGSEVLIYGGNYADL